MNNSKKASRIEWLCAAMIDFIPIISFEALRGFLKQCLFLKETIYVTIILLAVYMLLKDFFFDGRSIGKRFVNIQIVRPENSRKSCLILRNLPISLVTLIWLGSLDIEMIPLSLCIMFSLYMWADFICFALKGKTIGDCLSHTTLEVSENPNFLLQKNVSKRIACFVVALILFGFEGISVSPYLLNILFDETLISLLNLSYTQSFSIFHSIHILYQCAIYVYILCKMIEYKHLRRIIIALFSVFLCCDIYIWNTVDNNVSWIFMFYIIIIAILLYMTTDRRLSNSQIRTDFENRLWSGCDLQKVKIYVTIVVMVLIISVLSPIVNFVSESYDGYNSLFTLLFSASLPILLVIFPVVYLSEKYINQKSLRWIIYIATLLYVIFCHSSLFQTWILIIN